jgi:hypothetical protein
MKTFKEFAQIDELKTALPKAGSEKKFVQSTYLAQVKDPGDLEKVGPEEEGPHDTKKSSGKRKADRLDNKQAFGEESVSKKAYATIKSKTQNEEHQDALMALFDELNESNQQMFMQKLEQNVDKLIEFATSRHEV